MSSAFPAHSNDGRSTSSPAGRQPVGAGGVGVLSFQGAGGVSDQLQRARGRGDWLLPRECPQLALHEVVMKDPLSPSP